MSEPSGITAVYQSAIQQVTSRIDRWLAFLETSARLYDRPFSDQIMIHVQNPDATKCATLPEWNRAGWWVKSTAHSIAVLDDADNPTKPVYLFDAADTAPMRGTRPVVEWELPEDFRAPVLDQLAHNAPGLSFEHRIYDYIFDVVQEYTEENYDDILDMVESVYPHDEEPESIMQSFTAFAAASAAYAVILRSGGDIRILTMGEFIDFPRFNKSRDAFAALGRVCHICENVVLKQIEEAVHIYQNDNLAKIKREIDNRAERETPSETENKEGKTDDGDHLQARGRLPVPGLRDRGNTAAGDREIRDDAQDIPERAASSDIRVLENERDTGGEMPECGQTGMGTGRTGNDPVTGSDRTPGQGDRPPWLDTGDEPFEEPSRGTGDSGSGFEQISLFGEPGGSHPEEESPTEKKKRERAERPTGSRAGDAKSPAFSVVEDKTPLTREEISEILRNDREMAKSKAEIAAFFQTVIVPEDRAAFMEEAYKPVYIGILRDDGQRYGHYKSKPDPVIDAHAPDREHGLLIVKGTFMSPADSITLSWDEVQAHVAELIEDGTYLDSYPAYTGPEKRVDLTPEPQEDATLPVVDNAAPNEVSSEDIRAALMDGSNIVGGKQRIFELYNKTLPTHDRIQYLKNEYGTGGRTFIFPDGSNGYIDYSPKGFNIYKNSYGSDPSLTLKWGRVDKEIRALVLTGQYISDKPDEKDDSAEYKLAEDLNNFYKDFDPFEHANALSDYGDDETMTIDSLYDSIVTGDTEYFLDSLGEIYEEQTDTELLDLVASLIQRLEMFTLQAPDIDAVRDDDIQTIQSAGSPKIAPTDKDSGEDAAMDLLHEDIPIPELPPNFRIPEGFWKSWGIGSEKIKIANNLSAIRILKEIELEERPPAQDEQEIMARYVGWGGLPQMFDEGKPEWREARERLQELLTGPEYKTAKASTLNAHYTTPVVIKSIYRALENMGFRSGNILEPAVGVGNFYGTLPDSMQNSKLYGTEIDSITGRLARNIYPQADIEIRGFEDTSYPDAFFDVALGNVPFGNYEVADKRYDHLRMKIHDYFFAKTLDKVRPGGVIAFVTSKGTMDKQDETVRKYISERAELMGAIRLPNNTFEGNAGTQVTTDILFLKRRDKPHYADEPWLHLSETLEGIPCNRYYIENPHMMLGTMAWDKSMYGNEKTTACHPIEGSDLYASLSEAIRYINGAYEPAKIGTEQENQSIPADPTVRNYSYTLVDGKLYFRINSIMEPANVNITQEDRIRSLIEIRDCVREVISLQLAESPDEDISAKQADLNRLYDRFARKFGRINSRANSLAFRDDDGYYLLCSLEVIDDDGNFERKADMFTKRTVRPAHDIKNVDSAVDALAVSISEKAKVDLPFMQGLFTQEISIDEITQELQGAIFHDPLYPKDDLKGWQPADEYLSGNVREKLKTARLMAESDPDYQVNVQYLLEAQPKDLEASEIEVRLGATWIPKEDVQEFMYELFHTSEWVKGKIQVLLSERTNEWNITNKSAEGQSNNRVNLTYGTHRMNAYHIIENTLNLRTVKIYDYYKDAEGKQCRELNSDDTMLAQQRQNLIKDEFKNWIFAWPERRERLVALYNDKMNAIRPREFDGRHIRFVGMNPEITLDTHQKNAVARMLYGENVLLAHVVGAGKTFSMAAGAMESKRIGRCTKSLFAVPNHLTQQFAGEFLQLYPSANLLVTTKEDFEKVNRKAFCAKIAAGEYDAVIMGHTQFEKVPMSDERQIAMIEWQLEQLEAELEEMAGRDDLPRYTVKQVEKSKKTLETKLKRLSTSDRKDSVVTFEELGADKLFIDEAHYFKNLFLLTKMRNISGVSTSEAQKSTDLYMKCQYMDEITGGRGTVFATGTPISNSMTELYTMMRYLQMDLLQQTDMTHFDSWASTFGETVTTIELKPEGTGFRPKERFARFYNLPELMNMWKQAADIQTADMLSLPVPKLETGAAIDKVSESSNHQKAILKLLADRATKVRNGCDPRVDNMLNITTDGRKMALDQRLYDPNLPDDPDSKLNNCVDNVFKIWKETHAKKSTQLVFCDLGTPKQTVTYLEDAIDAETGQRFDLSFDVYQDIYQKLRRKNVPREDIAFVHDAKTDKQKAALFAKVRAGKVRILLGSTPMMGAGTNVQTRLVALHHLDVPWRPSDIEQREGRMLRQGNLNEVVAIFRYVTKGTFDAYSWAIIKNKQTFISQIMTSRTPLRSCDDVDETVLKFAEVMALATGDPRIRERVDLETDLTRLKVLRSGHLSQMYSLQDNIFKVYPNRIESNRKYLESLTKDNEKYRRVRPADSESFVMVINGATYTKKDAAGEAILGLKTKGSHSPAIIGEYCGFPLQVEYSIKDKAYLLDILGSSRYTITLGGDAGGNIQRIINKMDGFTAEMQKCETAITHWEEQITIAKEDVDKPFAHEQEIKDKQLRFDELNSELNMKEPESDLSGEEGRDESADFDFNKERDRTNDEPER